MSGSAPESVDSTTLDYEREWQHRIERRIDSVMFWRALAMIFASLCLFCLWIVAGIIVRVGFRWQWLGF